MTNDRPTSEARADRHGAVAVIVVHGVADQPRGETAGAVAMQLALELGAAVTRSDVPLHVPMCEPAVGYKPWHTEGRDKLWQAIRKSWGQSLRSDFVDPRLGGADSQHASPNKFETEALANSAKGKRTVEPGVRFTDFLFAKAYAWRMAQGPREAPVHTAARFDVAGPGPGVTVFEMYWADLSRLSGSAPRILTELFTLLFDLVRLGSHAVSMHAALFDDEPPSLTTLGRLQRLADHVYTRALAMLTLQLMLCALLIFAASAVARHASGLAYLGCVIVGIGVAAAIARVPRARSWLLGAAVGTVVAGALAYAVFVATQATPSPLVGIVIGVVVLLAAWVYAQLLNYWEQRFRAVLGFGFVFGLQTAACLAWGVIEHGGLFHAGGWLVGALRAMEVTLLWLIGAWCLLALICVAIIAYGWRAGLADPGSEAAASRQHVIRTGRLGLFASLGVFVVFTMAIAALLETPMCNALASTPYSALLIDRQAGMLGGCAWLHRQLASSTETFVLVALLLSLFVSFVVIVLAPCIGVETGLLRFKAAEIGAWLTRSYRAIERLLGWGSWVAVAGTVLAALLLGASLLRKTGLPVWPWVEQASAVMAQASAPLLNAVVVSIAGATTGLLAIGGLAIKRLQALRAPLDAALDVDVHFREFPRGAIPRVLIAERYVALLEHVLAQGFRQVVIVAHSQGTVITADLLRYLQQRPQLIDAAATRPDPRLTLLGAALARTEVDLLTVGCPLRQLYAQRFPSLYHWAHDPQPSQLGVRRWFNAWGSADYVGRWLWRGAGPTDAPDSRALDARIYEGAATQGPNWRDVCIGPDAHTHYFEAQQIVVRKQLLDLLQLSTQPHG